jgi:hypothetical protein
MSAPVMALHSSVAVVGSAHIVAAACGSSADVARPGFCTDWDFGTGRGEVGAKDHAGVVVRVDGRKVGEGGAVICRVDACESTEGGVPIPSGDETLVLSATHGGRQETTTDERLVLGVNSK